ncbi:WD40 repeat domain-containing protein [uncultured Gimesia sp.]|uniref:WD40 repeat domain-containing protein n=1 Tax=uncultured Gimesia sp. TaxID=1678688 RepID=UPI0030DCF451|tara:strand:+ start:55817 stop:58606 length:2790 start_codon:yes stop_codon:yes gene_type:complete
MKSFEWFCQRFAERHPTNYVEYTREFLKRTAQELIKTVRYNSSIDVVDNAQHKLKLLLHWRFVEARVEIGDTAFLIQDLYEAARLFPVDSDLFWHCQLLKDSIRQSNDWISRDSESLFQHVWNHSWWWHSEELKQHVVSDMNVAPEKQRILKDVIRPWLDEWKQGKEKNDSKFRWFRALRPPAENNFVFLRIQTETQSGASVDDYPCLESNGRDLLICGNDNGSVEFFSANNSALLYKYECHTEPVVSVNLSPSGNLFCSGSEDETVVIGNVRSGIIHRLPVGKLVSLCFNQVETEVSLLTKRQGVQSGLYFYRYRIHENDLIDYLKLNEDHETICLMDNGNKLLTVSATPAEIRDQPGKINFNLMECANQKVVWTQAISYKPQNGISSRLSVCSMDISKCNQFIALGCRHGLILIVDKLKGKIFSRFDEHVNPDSMFNPVKIRFSHDSRKLASGDINGRVYVQDVDPSSRVINCYQVESGVCDLVWLDEGKRISAVSKKGICYQWQLEGSEHLYKLKIANNKAKVIAVSESGKMFTTESQGDLVQFAIWYVDRPSDPLLIPKICSIEEKTLKAVFRENDTVLDICVSRGYAHSHRQISLQIDETNNCAVMIEEASVIDFDSWNDRVLQFKHDDFIDSEIPTLPIDKCTPLDDQGIYWAGTSSGYIGLFKLEGTPLSETSLKFFETFRNGTSESEFIDTSKSVPKDSLIVGTRKYYVLHTFYTSNDGRPGGYAFLQDNASTGKNPIGNTELISGPYLTESDATAEIDRIQEYLRLQVDQWEEEQYQIRKEREEEQLAGWSENDPPWNTAPKKLRRNGIRLGIRWVDEYRAEEWIQCPTCGGLAELRVSFLGLPEHGIERQMSHCRIKCDEPPSRPIDVGVSTCTVGTGDISGLYIYPEQNMKDKRWTKKWIKQYLEGCESPLAPHSAFS